MTMLLPKISLQLFTKIKMKNFNKKKILRTFELAGFGTRNVPNLYSKDKVGVPP